MRENIARTLPVLLACQAACAQYTLYPLDPPTGGTESVAVSIDEQGRIVGTVRLATFEFVAALWPAADQPVVVLGMLEGGTGSEAADARNGDVVGFGERACGQRGSFLWTSAGGLTPIGPDMCPATTAIAINANGEVLLQVGDPALPIVWPTGAGSPRVLETWGQTAQVYDLTDSGHIVGASNAHPSGGGRTRAIEWRPDGSARLLGRLDETAPGSDFAVERNESGLIVGQARQAGVTRATVWNTAGVALDAGEALGPTVSSSLLGVNNSGTAVGQSSRGAIVWTSADGARYLHDLVDETGMGWTLLIAQAINDAGVIVGLGTDPRGRPRGFALVSGGLACPADLDADGSLTIFDFLAFQNLFDSGDAKADFDGDGSLTIFDFLAFQNAFDAGC